MESLVDSQIEGCTNRLLQVMENFEILTKMVKRIIVVK